MNKAMAVFDLETQNQDLDSKITAALERISRIFRILMWDKAKKYRLSPIQMQILIYLKERAEERPGVTFLASEIGVTQPTISDSVQTLVEKGLVRRQEDARDRRRYILTLTARGEKMANELMRWGNPFRDVLLDIPFNRKVALWTSLLDLLVRLNQERIIPPARMCFTCRYLTSSRHEASEDGYRCRLLEIPLSLTDLRVDCPDHEYMEEIA